MSASADELRLDGNAAAGALGEVFAAEATTALATCASCGSTAPLARAMVYEHAPGLVLRCVSCEAVVLRVVRARDRLLVDLSGVRRIELG